MGLDVARDHAPPGESDRQAFDGRAAAHRTRAGDARQRPDVVPRRAILQRRREHAHRASLDPPGLGVPRRLDPVHVPQSARERGDRRPLRLPPPRADHRPRDRPGTQVDAPPPSLAPRPLRSCWSPPVSHPFSSFSSLCPPPPPPPPLSPPLPLEMPPPLPPAPPPRPARPPFLPPPPHLKNTRPHPPPHT